MIEVTLTLKRYRYLGIVHQYEAEIFRYETLIRSRKKTTLGSKFQYKTPFTFLCLKLTEQLPVHIELHNQKEGLRKVQLQTELLRVLPLVNSLVT